MIYGLLPVGGTGSRLGLPFPKELLPQKGFDYYNPLINHIVSKMLFAGAEQVYFIHGTEPKQAIVDFFSDPRFVHLTQTTLGFGRVIRDFYTAVDVQPGDSVLFGMPDTVFNGNPFPEMLDHSGIVCGIFHTDPLAKVDRLVESEEPLFEVKSIKTPTNTDWFWGILKFDGQSILQIKADKMLDTHTEVGTILNCFPNKTLVYAGNYQDLGTWGSYNKYLLMTHRGS